MSTSTARLSTCYHCGGTIRRVHFSNWQHVTPPKVEHAAELDDGAVSGPADDERGDDVFSRIATMETEDELDEIDAADYFGDERGSTSKIEDES